MPWVNPMLFGTASGYDGVLVITGLNFGSGTTGGTYDSVGTTFTIRSDPYDRFGTFFNYTNSTGLEYQLGLYEITIISNTLQVFYTSGGLPQYVDCYLTAASAFTTTETIVDHQNKLLLTNSSGVPQTGTYTVSLPDVGASGANFFDVHTVRGSFLGGSRGYNGSCVLGYKKIATVNTISFDERLQDQFEDSAGTPSYITYDGGLTRTDSTGFGVVSVSNSRIIFPAGTYVLNSGTITYKYYSGAPAQIDISVRIIEDDSVNNILLQVVDTTVAVEPGPFTTKEWKIVNEQLTFDRTTTVRIEYAYTHVASPSDITLPNLFIVKTA